MQAEGDPGAVGVLGGSGLYEFEGFEDMHEAPVSTPFGEPSAPPLVGRYAGRKVIFIPRHGRGHRFSPSDINYRANVCALKQLGATQVIAISAVGSLRDEIRPGDFVLVDQFIDRTHRRLSTFFGEGCVGHVSFAEPVCAELADTVAGAAAEILLTPVGGSAGRGLHVGGSYVCIEGPQFSTRAESQINRGLGIAVVGMTGVTEAKLCREAELCFTLLALATDYDCWRQGEESVTAAAVIEVLQANVAAAKDVLRRSLPRLSTARHCVCANAARHAILTQKESITPTARARLEALYGRTL
jgi:5'-methylthioadenosine phosphorylase